MFQNEHMLLDLLEILFPSECANCGYLGKALCERCMDSLIFEPHVREIEDLKVCVAMYYSPHSILEKLIKPFKYNHQKDIYRLFVPHMNRALKLIFSPEEIILVPVPLHKNRELERGYNQSEILANYLGRKNGVKVIKLIERAKNTEKQSLTKNRVEREENMKDAFKVVKNIPKDGHLVLVDDIVTSGSTLLACKKILREAGYEKISALTLAERESFRH